MRTALLAATSLLLASPAAAAGFNWDAWAKAVNEDPCAWLDEATLKDVLGPTKPGTPKVTKTQTTCTWVNEQGGLVFSASVHTWDSAVNLVGERKNQVKEASSGGKRFRFVGGHDGVVTAVLRTDRVTLMLFPNSDTESAVIVLSGHPVRGESLDVLKARNVRAEKFAAALSAKFGLQ